jgi:phage terminase large subunit GpA-like protein
VLKFLRRFYNIGTHAFKGSLYRDLAKDNPEEKGYVAFPNDLPMRYFEELVSERRVAIKRMGAIIYRWEKISDRQANECHDTFVYACAAAIRHGVNWISDQGWAERRAMFEGPPVKTPDGRVRLTPDRPSWASLLPR